MPVQPQPMDDLPIPKPVEVKTAEAPAPPPIQMPPGAGYSPRSGGVAHIAERILTGWMAGKKIREQRNQDKAVKEVGDARGIYETLAQQYKGALDAGRDPNTDEGLKNLKGQIAASWNNYLTHAEKYAGHDDTKAAKPKKGVQKVASPIGAALHRMFGVEDPNLIAKSSLDMLKQSGPPALNYSPDKTAALERETAELKLTEEKKKVAEQADISQLRKQRNDALAKGDEKAARAATEQLRGYGFNIEDQPTEEQRQLRAVQVETELRAFKALASGKTLTDLPPDQQVVMRVPPVTDAFGAYMSQVGQGKLFATQLEAARALRMDEARAKAMENRSHSTYEEMRQGERVVLQHDLLDPAKAKEYGIAPLRPGERVPDWVVEKATMSRLKETTEEKQQIMVQRKQAGNRAVQMVLKSLSPEDMEFARNVLLDQDDAGNYSLAPEGIRGDSESHYFKEDTISGVPKSKVAGKRKAFINQVSARLKQMYPGATDEVIAQALGVSPEALGDTNPERAAKPSPEPTQNPATKPGELSPTPTTKNTRTYMVTAADGTKAMELTDEEASSLKDRGVKVELNSKPIYSLPMHGR